MAARNKRSKDEQESVQEELEDIKRLLMLLLMKLGTDSDEIAVALGVAKSTITRTIPKRKVKGEFSFVSK